jgi:NAD(P)-dependent dehydrogenase (short-subunit alcohol dehydrogenase family)
VFGPLPKTATGKIQKFVLREAARGCADAQLTDVRRDCLQESRARDGASSGLGRHFAQLLAAHGRAWSPRAAAGRAGRTGRTLAAAPAASRSTSATRRAWRRWLRYGPLDIVVNNAGDGATTTGAATCRGGLAARARHQPLRARFASRGAPHGRCRSEARRRDRQHGLGPGLARRRSRYRPTSPQGRLISLTEALALELAPLLDSRQRAGARYVETDLNRDFLRSPAGETMVERVPHAAASARRTTWTARCCLPRDAGRYMTGRRIVVDGGHTLSWL